MEKVINSYEALFVVDLTAGEEAAKETASKFTKLISDNGEIISVDEWGKRRLAYPINDMNEGYYTVVAFKSEPAFPAELERLLNIDETVIRKLIIRLDHEPVAKSEETEKAPEEEAPVAEEPASDAE